MKLKARRREKVLEENIGLVEEMIMSQDGIHRSSLQRIVTFSGSGKEKRNKR